ncbi:MAG: 50S ribosomal protein L15 [Planctomycetaceae bacterium]
MILDDVHRGIVKRRERKRLGRGIGSGQGKTAGKGHKGHSSRSGFSRRLGFEGGQTPLLRRVAKRGFSNKYFAADVAIVNLADLEAAFDKGATVNAASLAEKGLIRANADVVKVLGNGQLTKKLTVEAHRFSKSAEAKITAQGGTVTKIAKL